METEFKITRKSREIFNQYFENYTLEQLNKIPQGHNNNLIWHIGHIIVSQQALVYKGANQQPNVSEELIARYMRGTKPERDATQAEAEEIRSLLFAPLEKTEQDYRSGLFTSYNARKSELGFDLLTIEDAIAFNNYHEAIHLGIMLQLRKLV
ncbi:DinB family protein [Flavobacterium zepuense]|uniref:DinB family protein n=1 Tax=Flavobacterium zepuense TaxID=2593302 RepID=A0A552UWY3_9FLAO|nr:DinB family protein [Flavobacterium zepuense]TRW22728.1 DinB family protein [Flavobacterium zepuense]